MKQDINMYVAYSRQNGWTDSADIFCGQSWVAGGIKVKKNRHIFFQNYSTGKRLVIQLVIKKIQPNNYYMQMGVSNNIKG